MDMSSKSREFQAKESFHNLPLLDMRIKTSVFVFLLATTVLADKNKNGENDNDGKGTLDNQSRKHKRGETFGDEVDVDLSIDLLFTPDAKRKDEHQKVVKQRLKDLNDEIEDGRSIVFTNGKRIKPDIRGIYKRESAHEYQNIPSMIMLPGQKVDFRGNTLRNKRKVLVSGAWAKAIIPYAFDAARPFTDQATQEAVVRQAMDAWEAGTCVQFRFRNSSFLNELGHDDFVSIGSGSGCMSYIGWIHNGAQQIWLGTNGCGLQSVAHELGHSLSFFHEQNREDRDKYINFLCDRTTTPLDGNNLKLERYGDVQNYAPYEINSVMSYAATLGSLMEVRNPELDYLGTSRAMPTHYDMLSISKHYKCQGNCTGTCNNDGYMIMKAGVCVCVCVSGLTGTTCDQTQTQPTCGGVVSLSSNGAITIISSPNYPSAYPAGSKCIWLLQAPTGYLVKMNMDMNLPQTATVCRHWVDVRNNMIGQLGKKYCGAVNGVSISSKADFKSSKVLITLDATNTAYPPGGGFTMRVQAVKDGCYDEPCKGGMCTAVGLADWSCSFSNIALSCDFNSGCLCPGIVQEKVYPEESWNWMPDATNPLEGAYAFRAMAQSFTATDQATFSLLPVSYDACLSFGYQSQGGNLDVSVFVNGVKQSSLVNQVGTTNGWKSVTFPVARSGDLVRHATQVLFTATKGAGTGMILVDSISLVQNTGQCGVDVCASKDCQGYSCISLGGLATCQYPDPASEYTCNFENGICNGLSQSKTDNFDWTIASGDTPTANTGPSSAYSGTYYAYTEATGQAAGAKAVLRLVPPFTSTTGRCFQFRYHMFGSTLGSLSVYYGGSRVWSSSTSFDGWNLGVVPIAAGPTGEIQIEGIIGSGDLSDIAIDFIKYTIGQCPDPSIPDPTTWTCSFENNALCTGLTQSLNDQLDWTIWTGDTPTAATGPSQGADGTVYYAYLETSSPALLDDTAVLTIDTAVQLGVRCLAFKYNMYGVGTGSLNIYYSLTNTLGTAIWSQSGDKGPNWIAGQVQINHVAGAKVYIEARRGTDQTSDIAIDQLGWTSGSCPTPVVTTAAPTTTTTTTATPTANPSSIISLGNVVAPFINRVDDKQLDFVPTATSLGPVTSEYTGTANGFYLMVKPLATTVTNDTAVLETPLMTGNITMCLTETVRWPATGNKLRIDFSYDGGVTWLLTLDTSGYTWLNSWVRFNSQWNLGVAGRPVKVRYTVTMAGSGTANYFLMDNIKVYGAAC